MKHKSEKIKFFNLIELLVVISILAILCAILLPSMGKAKEFAYRIVCWNNERNIAFAFKMYYEDHDRYPDTPYWLDDFSPIFGYVNTVDVFTCPSMHHPLLSSTTALAGQTDYYKADTMKDIELRGSLSNNGFGNNAYAFDPSNPSIGDLMSLKTGYECVYDSDYRSHDGWINVCFIRDLHVERAYGVGNFWYLDGDGDIIKNMDPFPDID